MLFSFKDTRRFYCGLFQCSLWQQVSIFMCHVLCNQEHCLELCWQKCQACWMNSKILSINENKTCPIVWFHITWCPSCMATYAVSSFHANFSFFCDHHSSLSVMLDRLCKVHQYLPMKHAFLSSLLQARAKVKDFTSWGTSYTCLLCVVVHEGFSDSFSSSLNVQLNWEFTLGDLMTREISTVLLAAVLF